MDMVRIVVVDDFLPFREAIRKFLDGFAALKIIGEAGDGNAAIEMTILLVPEVVIMDVKMPRLDGVEATRRIKRVLPAVHVVGVSSLDDSMTREAMILAGCSAFIAKECAHTLPEVIAKITGRQVANDAFFPESIF